MTDPKPNRLADQASLYLRAHAEDPVEWYPWGREAFARAAELGRPVFVSIGYASCHWCHVMQRESFRDALSARQLNEHFVSIKVDRELRPDVDHIYMTYVTLAAGHGGWPMNVFTTPKKSPFFGGTYFPRKAPPSSASFSNVLEGVWQAFSSDQNEVDAVGAEALQTVASAMQPVPMRPIDLELVATAATEIANTADHVNGGLGDAPKFPQAPIQRFLTEFAAQTGDEEMARVARQWLESMVRSGTYDQVGGGLFRYSTDAEWLVPHFEKMLYDNGLLLSAIAASYAVQPGDDLAAAARQTAAFLKRDLGAPEGGYYSSLDAETDGVEGQTYVWTSAELAEALDADELAVAEKHLGVSVESSDHKKLIITRRQGRAEDAEAVDAVLAKLLEVRATKPQPKVVANLLAEWNALAARGLLEAGHAIGDDALVAQGVELAEWLRDNAVVDGRVLHAIGDESVAGLDFIADYAAVAAAFATAARVTGDDAWRTAGETLLDRTAEVFDVGSVLYMTGADHDLPLRPISYDDSPTPSGAATYAETLQALRPDDRDALVRVLIPATGIVVRAPYVAGTWLQTMARKVAAEPQPTAEAAEPESDADTDVAG